MIALIRTRRFLTAICTGVGIALSAPAIAADDFQYGPETIDVAAHWAARSTLANAVMFSGLGESLSMSMTTMDEVLKHAGYVTRPPMPDMAMVGAVYAGGNPGFQGAPDFSAPQTLGWDASTFDRTLEPAAQAWALIKITGPAFHLNFHDRKEDKRIALVMLPQARSQAGVLRNKLLTDQGLFAARRPDGAFIKPVARDQAVVLWGVSNVILAATSTRDDYWHKAYRDLVDADDFRELAGQALSAVDKLPPESPADRALAVEALGRYALATTDTERRKKALTLTRTHADALLQVDAGSLEDSSLAIYGLIEASRLLDDSRYSIAATSLFRSALLPKWDDQLNVFKADGPIIYTPENTAAVAAALNAVRWHGPADAAQEATQLYPKFLETVLVRAGLLLSSPLPLVPADYRKDRPDAAFAHPALPSPETAKVAPVFGGEVRFEQGTWRISDQTFRTVEAMFLANMLVMPHAGQADAFLPADRLASLQR